MTDRILPVDAERRTSSSGPGEVYIVGAGPGDPDLLTFRAFKLLQRADIVLYDRLVSAEILAHARRDAQRIYVGKARDQHAMAQSQINASLVEYAQAGFTVCRLKGGDPFIFGRGGEEVQALAEAGIRFEVVPGVTAAAGCAAYAGIALTHRDCAQSVTFVAGHRRQGLDDESLGLNWAHLSSAGQTVVFYMGLQQLPTIARQLMRHGAPPERPAAVIENGTLDNQRVISATLETLVSTVQVQAAGISGPALIIVGEVVEARQPWQRYLDVADEIAAHEPTLVE